MTSTIRLACLSTCGLILSGCARSPDVSNPSAQQAPVFTKRVEVTLVAKGSTTTNTISYTVGPNAQLAVAVFWDGSAFVTKDDGRELFRQVNGLAFKNGPSAEFKISRIVSITTSDGTYSKTTESSDITVKRGVKAIF